MIESATLFDNSSRPAEQVDWPHQVQGVADVKQYLTAGGTRVVVSSPTGGGKSVMMVRLIEWARSMDYSVALYSHRKMLTKQLSDVLESRGIRHGIRASGHLPRLNAPVQICSIQTEATRRSVRPLHSADLVIFDEAHLNKAGTAEEIAAWHEKNDAVIVGFTATPVGIGHMYDRLIQAGYNSDLRSCGALVPCYTYGPTEPDMRKIKQTPTGEYTENDIRKVIMTQTIFGHVLEWHRKLNPDLRPAILFAPGVAESQYFAEQYDKAGIPAATIDGKRIWIDGEDHPTSPDLRQQVLDASRDGRIKVVCNRFVLREAIDMPWIYHGIGATVFGSLQSFVQSGGRILRNHAGIDDVIWQDHGGSWHRHGSLNSDREWDLSYSAGQKEAERADCLREKVEPEPIQCPKCKAIRSRGPKCIQCGFMQSRSSRMVMQENGTLKEMTGDVYKRRRRKETPSSVEDWKKMYHRAKNAKMTFRQAEALFAMDHNWCYPPRDLPMMPKDIADWGRKVRDVPSEDLIH